MCDLSLSYRSFMHKYPLVSVIIPTYNRFITLIRAIDSVRKQTYPRDRIEIIIINDKSTDLKYYAKNEEFEDCIVVNLAISSKEALGHGAAGYVRNYGFSLASGEYIALLDDDDLWIPEKLEKQILEMRANDCEICSSDGYIGCTEDRRFLADNGIDYTIYAFRCSNTPINKLLDIADDGISYKFPKFLSLAHLLANNIIMTSSIIFSKRLLDITGKMGNMKDGEDFDFWIRMLAHTDKILYIDEPLIHYDIKSTAIESSDNVLEYCPRMR